MSGVRLRGMTWSHPRGYDPMVAGTEKWAEATGHAIDWDKRSLQDFESFPVEELARNYDLIIIDHPHVGQITKEGCLVPLDGHGRDAEFGAMAAASVGLSFPSYNWQGHQWAFPVDAAAQVQAFRPDLIDAPAQRWNAVLDLARDGRVMLPLRPPHVLMSFFTLAGNLGTPCSVERGPMVAREDGARVVTMLAEIARLVDPACFTMDPIAVYEEMATPASRCADAPLIYGYVNYALDGFRDRRLAFANIPAAGSHGVAGSALGGTGIAVSARSAHAEAAVDFAYFITSGAVQSGLYAAAGGQPGHAAAWESDAVNAPTHDFYRATRATMEASWLRPRHDGYMPFQDRASERLIDAIRKDHDPVAVVDDLNAMFEATFAG